MINYLPPASWHDKGMNWENPDPCNVDYAMALKLAIIERCCATGLRWDLSFLELCHIYCPLRYDYMKGIQDILKDLAPYFLNNEYDGYDLGQLNKPKYWSYSDLNDIDDCRICELPPHGVPVTATIQWMIHARNYLNKLLICRAKAKFKAASGSGVRHVTEFPTAYSEAIDYAMEDYNEERSNMIFREAYSVEFGAYENNCPYGSDGVSHCSSSVFMTIHNIHFFPENNFIFQPVAVVVADSAIHCGYPHHWTIMQEYRWNNAGLPFSQGMTIYSPYIPFDINASGIPVNTMKPRDDPAQYYATSIGIWGEIYFFKDYCVDGGFKFRPDDLNPTRTLQ